MTAEAFDGVVRGLPGRDEEGPVTRLREEQLALAVSKRARVAGRTDDAAAR